MAQQHTTHEVPASTRAIVVFKVVKVARLETGVVQIYSQDRSIVMFSGSAAKRLARGESFAYFRAELDQEETLTIGDRVPTPSPAW